MFRNNSEFILPHVLEKLPVPFKYIKDVYIEELAFSKFIVITVKDFTVSENKLLESPNFYSVVYKGLLTIIRYQIPNHVLLYCNVLIQSGYDALTKDLLMDCIKFWKENSFFVLVNKKTQTARGE